LVCLVGAKEPAAEAVDQGALFQGPEGPCSLRLPIQCGKALQLYWGEVPDPVLPLPVTPPPVAPGPVPLLVGLPKPPLVPPKPVVPVPLDPVPVPAGLRAPELPPIIIICSASGS